MLVVSVTRTQLAEQAQACGRRKGWRARCHLSWPLVVTAGKKKTAFLACHPCPGGYADLLCIVQRKKKLELCVSSPCQDHANLHRRTKKKHLELCVSPFCLGPRNFCWKKNFSDSSALCRDHANLHCILSAEKKLDCTDAGLSRDICTFGRAVEGTSVSPFTNAMGGPSG